MRKHKGESHLCVANTGKHISDRAKREFTIDSKREIKNIRAKYQQRDSKGRQIKPNFFAPVAKLKGYYDTSKKNYKQHRTTMDYIQHAMNVARTTYISRDFVPFSSLVKDASGEGKVSYYYVNRVLDTVRNARTEISKIWSTNDVDMSNDVKSSLSTEIRQNAIDFVAGIELSHATMRRLLVSIEDNKNKSIGKMILFTLFGAPNESFYSLLKASATPIQSLIEDENGDIELYGIRFSYIDA